MRSWSPSIRKKVSGGGSSLALLGSDLVMVSKWKWLLASSGDPSMMWSASQRKGPLMMRCMGFFGVSSLGVLRPAKEER